MNVVNNPKVFDPPVVLDFQDVEVSGGIVMRVWVPPSALVHRFKGVAYERVEDSDVQIRTSAHMAELYIRKQNIYTEQQVLPHVELGDLDTSVLAQARESASRVRGNHPWLALDDMELLRSAGLYAKNFATGEVGFNVAAVLLLGRDITIKSVIPGYKTDVLWQENVERHRYDDRLTVVTNLVHSYSLIANFCRRYLPNRFVTDADRSVSARDVIVRELVVNSLIHREFSSPYPARITITPSELHAENASRAVFSGGLSPQTFNPYSKNPLIAGFFSNIGLAEELGSGTRALFKYTPLYSGSEPELKEGNVFVTRIPVAIAHARSEAKPVTGTKIDPTTSILNLAQQRGEITVAEVQALGIARRTAQRVLAKLVHEAQLVAIGTTSNRKYRLISETSSMPMTD